VDPFLSQRERKSRSILKAVGIIAPQAFKKNNRRGAEYAEIFFYLFFLCVLCASAVKMPAAL
jgi:hypothetical protein